MAEARHGSARDIPGRKREYETIYILRPDASNDAIAAVNAKIRGVIESKSGKLLKVENWGKRRLAYEVQKQLKGVYLFFNYLGGSDLVDEVERNLRLSDTVIRYYTVKTEENVDPAARTSSVTDESFASAAIPTADEEAIAMGQASASRTLTEEEEEAASEFADPLLSR